MARETFTFVSAGAVVFGNGSVRRLPALLQRIGVKKPMLVTTGLKGTGVSEMVLSLLDRGSFAVYDRVTPEPRSTQAIECAELAKEEGCDGFIGLGGGSSLDLAKVAALVATHGGRPREYIGEDRVPGPVLPVVAIPTTSGSGSEVTSVASLTHDEDHSKAGISSDYLRPKVALVDPLLTVSLPPKLTAATGMDALAHAIEAFTAVDYRYTTAGEDAIFCGSNPVADCLAARAIGLVMKNLRTAVLQGRDVKARYEMALASVMAGLAFGSAGLGATHAAYYAVAELTGLSHAMAVGMMLPHVMQFNLPANPARYAEVARCMGIVQDNQVSPIAAGELAVQEVRRLSREIGIPQRLSEVGIKAEDVPVLAKSAMRHERLVRGNARAMDAEQFEELFRAAL